jgi:hypothetical protein
MKMPTNAEYVGAKIDKVVDILQVVAANLEAIVTTKPVVNVTNNSNPDPVNSGPNAAGLAMLVGAHKGFSSALREILDDSTLDAFKKAQKLRKLVVLAEQIQKEHEKALEELQKNRDKADGD